MSAFVVQTNCMDKCVAAIVALGGDLRYAGVPEISALVATSPQALGAALYAFNSRQVAQRYPGDDDMAGIPPWTYSACKTAQPIAGLKALETLEYQCAEGDCDDQPLYAELITLTGFIALRILRKLPAWQDAPWD